MGKKAKKLIGSSMSVLVVASSMNLNALSVVHATDTLTKNASKIISPVMISEIVADTHQSDMETASGTDAFEYIELYNTTNQTLDMDNYLIQNVNGENLNGKYVEVQLYSKRDVFLGREYIQIENIEEGPQAFEMLFKLQDVASYEVSIVDEKQEGGELELLDTDLTTQQIVVLTALTFLILW